MAETFTVNSVVRGHHILGSNEIIIHGQDRIDKNEPSALGVIEEGVYLRKYGTYGAFCTGCIH